jgi:MFS family permease
MKRSQRGITRSADLQLTVGYRYSIITLVFFISYVILQPPATVVLRKVGPRIFLPTITILWGITMICFGFVLKWTQMIPLRIVLGIFEAGFFPGKLKS